MFSAIKRVLNPYNVPKLNWEALAEDAKFTPDFPILAQSQWQPLFAYGEMQDTYPFQYFTSVRKARFMGFSHEKFSLWKDLDAGRETRTIALDEAYDSHPKAPKLTISGTLYYLAPEDIKPIDKYMGNTVFSQRRMVKIITPSMRSDGKFDSSKIRYDAVSAWMHVGIQEHWDTHLTGDKFKPVGIYTSEVMKIKQYYQYNRSEYSGK